MPEHRAAWRGRTSPDKCRWRYSHLCAWRHRQRGGQCAQTDGRASARRSKAPARSARAFPEGFPVRATAVVAPCIRVPNPHWSQRYFPGSRYILSQYPVGFLRLFAYRLLTYQNVAGENFSGNIVALVSAISKPCKRRLIERTGSSLAVRSINRRLQYDGTVFLTPRRIR